MGLTGRVRSLELRQKRKPAGLAMRRSQVTFSEASLVGQTARLQGQADGGSNLQSEARGLAVAAGEGRLWKLRGGEQKQQRIRKDPSWMKSGQGLGSRPLLSPAVYHHSPWHAPQVAGAKAGACEH